MNKQFRTFVLSEMQTRRNAINEEVISIAMSSETPYLRHRTYGHTGPVYEVVGHNPDEIVLDYAKGAPFCFEHDWQNQIGVLENIALGADKVLRADVRFSSLPFAQNIQTDMQRGIRPHVSVGFEVLKYQDVGTAADDIPIVRVTSWRLFEASSVSIPADNVLAGVGKSITSNGVETMAENEKADEAAAATAPAVSPDVIAAIVQQVLSALNESVKADSSDVATDDSAPVDDAANANVPQEDPVKAAKQSSALFTVVPASKPNTNGVAQMAKENGLMKADIAKIVALATKHNATEKLTQWLSDGTSFEAISAEILETKSNTNAVIGAPALHLKKNDRESFAGAVKAFLNGESSELAERGLEAKVKSGKGVNPQALYLPTDVPMLRSNMFRQGMMTRTGTTYGMGNSGVNAVGKEFLTWEEALREESLLAKVGGDVRTFANVASLPYFTTPTSAATTTETGSLAEQQVEVGVRNITPHRIGARYSFSNQISALDGTYSFEQELYTDLVAEGARIFEAQVWGGAGTGTELLGFTNDSNISQYAPVGTSGSLSIANANGMITVVAKANGTPEQGAWVLSHDVYTYVASTPVFGTGSGKSILEAMQATNPVYRSGFLSAPNTPLVTALFGNFSKTTAAMFGPVGILKDEITQAQNGKTILQLEMFADCVVRQPAALVRWTKVIAP